MYQDALKYTRKDWMIELQWFIESLSTKNLQKGQVQIFAKSELSEVEKFLTGLLSQIKKSTSSYCLFSFLLSNPFKAFFSFFFYQTIVLNSNSTVSKSNEHN